MKRTQQVSWDHLVYGSIRARTCFGRSLRKSHRPLHTTGQPPDPIPSPSTVKIPLHGPVYYEKFSPFPTIQIETPHKEAAALQGKAKTNADLQEAVRKYQQALEIFHRVGFKRKFLPSGGHLRP